MKLPARHTAATALLLGSLMLLPACGGGDDSGGTSVPPTSTVPPSASASVDGFIAYLQALIASAADTLEPVSTTGVTPPVDDKSEPAPIS